MENKRNQPAPVVQPTYWPSTRVVCISAFLDAGLGIGIYFLIQKKQNQKIVSNSDKSETKYVLVSMNGTSTTFTEAQVLEIKRLHEDGTSPIDIAEQFNTNVLMVSRIVYGIKI